jgi:hypothetical protein
MTNATLAEIAHIQAHGYRVQRETDAWGEPHPSLHGWTLTYDDRCGNGPFSLLIGEHGMVSPTRWEAVAEAQKRIAEDAI